MSLEGEPAIQLWLFDKAYQRKGPVPAPEAVEWTLVWNGAKSLVFTVLANNPRLSAIAADGARIVATIMRDGYPAPKVLVSGPVMERRGVGLTNIPVRVFEVAGDFSDVFESIIGWPKPAAAITAQTDAYYTVTGTCDHVVRNLVSANAPRQGVAVTVAAGTGIGPTTTVTIRMHPLQDRLFPKVSDLGFEVDVQQLPDESVRRLLTRVPTVHTRALTEESGIVQPGAEFSVSAPTATRVVVAAGGEGAARVFREIIDTAAETKYGVSRAITVDARDIETTDPDMEDLIQERAAEALAENAETTSLSIQLAETGKWQYGLAFELGDVVPITLVGESTITDRITEVSGSWSADGGLEVTPRVGAYEESPSDRLYRLVAKALKAGRNLEVAR
jgi:hypothetical protein